MATAQTNRPAPSPATRRTALACVATLALIATLTAGAVRAQDETETGAAQFNGTFRLGYRSVDIGGAETKYREDFDLDDGARLFGLHLELVPSAENRQVADRVELDLANVGGDPFETFRFNMRKHGRYDLRWLRTKSSYFYEDTILPIAQATPSISDGGDFHTFDFDRVRDAASFKLDLSERAQLNVGFDRFTKKGDSTTTLDIQRDEFELDRPLEETYDDINVGFQYAWDRVTLILEERRREYQNAGELFLPGLSLGEDPDDATVLDFFFFEQPWEYTSQQHLVRVHARPNDRLQVKVSGLLQTLDLDVTADERSQGTTFTGAPTTTDAEGSGDITRDIELFEVDVAYRVSDRVAVVANARRQQLDQDGRFLFDGDLNRGRWDIETTGMELGIDVDVTSKVVLSGGVRVEERDVDHAAVAGGDLALVTSERQRTDHEGFYARAAWRPNKQVRIDAEIENSTYDDPFTLSSPSDRMRYRLRGRLRLPSGFYGQATLRAQRVENDNAGWDADTDQIDLRLGYRREGLDLSLGYANLEADRHVDQTVTTAPGFGGGVEFLFPVLFQSDTDVIDALVRWQLHPRVHAGAEARRYDNSGSFGVERDDLRIFVECTFHEDYLVHVAFRSIDYEEDATTFDNYDADIVELSIGYNW